jgi:iron complex transport system permease protein
LALALLGAAFGALMVGSTELWSPADCLSGLWGALGGEPGLDQARQRIFDLRLARALTGLGVGAALALSGALMQGVFRNDLASPSVLGVSSGASVGASLVLMALSSGGGARALLGAGGSPLLVTAGALLGALVAMLLVASVATRAGRISVPTLLLLGIALNATLGGFQTLLHSLALADFEVARALMVWGFGTLDDRLPAQLWLLFAALLLCSAAIPFVAKELDLFESGEEDAAHLGVDIRTIRILSLGAACLAAAAAVAVAWQIGFVGLVVPHLARLVFGRSYRRLLPACLLGGPALLLGIDTLQRLLLPKLALGPGVLMSLVGGPFFFFLLLQQRGRLRTW